MFSSSTSHPPSSSSKLPRNTWRSYCSRFCGSFTLLLPLAFYPHIRDWKMMWRYGIHECWMSEGRRCICKFGSTRCCVLRFTNQVKYLLLLSSCVCCSYRYCPLSSTGVRWHRHRRIFLCFKPSDSKSSITQVRTFSHLTKWLQLYVLLCSNRVSFHCC